MKNNNIKPHTETVKFSIKWQAGHKSLNTALFQFDLWMKYYSVTSQMKLLQQYFHMILFTSREDEGDREGIPHTHPIP